VLRDLVIAKGIVAPLVALAKTQSSVSVGYSFSYFVNRNHEDCYDKCDCILWTAGFSPYRSLYFVESV
jgi:hypothetical protein